MLKIRSHIKWFLLAMPIAGLLALVFYSRVLAAYGALHGVRSIESQELIKLSKNPNLLLADVRQKKEFAVSHLKGAEENINWELIDKNRPVVLYCTIGYRSIKWGAALNQRGFHHIYNLNGGILRWKNEGHVVVNQKNQRTDSVHVYSRLFGFLLRKGQAVR